MSMRFPQIGTATSEIQTGCFSSIPTETGAEVNGYMLLPKRRDKLLFAPITENNGKMKEWLLKQYTSSTFNRCLYQTFPKMSGPPTEIRINQIQSL